jgi:DNA-binding GntR family transcriptional regulator
VDSLIVQPAPTQFRRQGAADQIAGILTERILGGVLRPGDSMREAELAAEFSVARNTVREALRLLTREGLAVHEVHRGVTVREFTVEEIRHIYDVRIILQSESGRRAGHLSAAEHQRLSFEVNEGIRHRAAGDARQWMTHNMRFHQETVALLNNPRLNEIFAGLVCEIRLVLSGLERDPSPRWDEGNTQLLDILNKGTEADYRTAVTEYLTESCADVTQRMDSN